MALDVRTRMPCPFNLETTPALFLLLWGRIHSAWAGRLLWCWGSEMASELGAQGLLPWPRVLSGWGRQSLKRWPHQQPFCGAGIHDERWTYIRCLGVFIILSSYDQPQVRGSQEAWSGNKSFWLAENSCFVVAAYFFPLILSQDSRARVLGCSCWKSL